MTKKTVRKGKCQNCGKPIEIRETSRLYCNPGKGRHQFSPRNGEDPSFNIKNPKNEK